jgi:hypothetical protein
VGVELNAAYIDIAAKRLGQPALLTVDDFVDPSPPPVRQLELAGT